MAPIGIWKTDAPISGDRFDELRAALHSVSTAIDGIRAYADHDIVVDELVVYIDGVKWTYEKQRVLGDL